MRHMCCRVPHRSKIEATSPVEIEEIKQSTMNKTVEVEAVAVTENQLEVRDITFTSKRPLLECRGNTLYGEANFFIISSKVYFKNRIFRQYIQCYPWVYPFLLIASIFAFLHNTYAVLVVIANMPFLIIYIQHACVYITTMRYVLVQPDLPDGNAVLQGTCNRHIEVSYEQYKMSYARANGVEVGTISCESGRIQLQVFSQSTKKRLQSCATISTGFLIASSVMIFYSLVWTISLISRCGLCGSSNDVEEKYVHIYFISCFAIFVISELCLAVYICIKNAKSLCHRFKDYFGMFKYFV